LDCKRYVSNVFSSNPRVSCGNEILGLARRKVHLRWISCSECAMSKIDAVVERVKNMRFKDILMSHRKEPYVKKNMIFFFEEKTM
jgi:hypothetical protein